MAADVHRAASKRRVASRIGVAVSCALLVCVAVGSSAPAQAASYRMFSETIGDAYQLVTSDNAILNRRRLHQYVGFGAYDLLGDGSNNISGTLLMRFDADFGLGQRELENEPLLERQQLSLQYAYVDARELGGLVDVRLGRQLHYDALDFTMLDGAVVMIRSPWHVGLEVLAGLEVKEANWSLNANQLELDGVRILQGDDAEKNDAHTVAVGVALTTLDLWNTRARVAYRRLFSDGRVDQEKVGATIYQRVEDVLHLRGTMSYDFYNGRFDRIQAGARLQATDYLDVELEYLRLLPSFDADSIFNIFTAFAMNDGNVRVRLHPSDDSLVYAGGMVRLYGNEGYTDGLLVGSAPDTVVSGWGAMAGYWQRFGLRGRVHADVSWQGGYGGDRVLGDVGGTWAVAPGEWELDGRLTVVAFKDALQPNLDDVSFGYQLGGKYLVDSRAAVALLVEHNFSELHSQQLRVFIAADINFWL